MLDTVATDSIVSWRLHVLLLAGYAVADAELLADSDVDLHAAVALIEAGCSSRTAVRILI